MRALYHVGVLGKLVRSVTATLAVLVLSHDIVYLVSYGTHGFGPTMASRGHDAYWLPLGTAVAVLGVLRVGASAWRRRTLMDQLRSLAASRSGRHLSGWQALQSAACLLVAATLLFVVQENIEHYVAHAGHLPWLSVLIGGEYAGTLPAFGVLSLLVGTLFAWLEAEVRQLTESVAAAVRTALRQPRHRLWAAAQTILVRSISGVPGLGRAPPLGSAPTLVHSRN